MGEKVYRTKVKTLPLEEVGEGMKLAAPVFDPSSGQVLLEKGVILSNTKIDHLKRHGIKEIKVEVVEEEELSEILEKLEEAEKKGIGVPKAEQMEEIEVGEKPVPPSKEEIEKKAEEAIKKLSERPPTKKIWETPAFQIKEPANKELAAPREKLEEIVEKAAEEEERIREKAREEVPIEQLVEEIKTPEEYDQKEEETKKVVEQQQQEVTAVVDKVIEKEEVDVDKAEGVTDSIITTFVKSRDVLLGLLQLKALGNYLYPHSLNTTILAVHLGAALGYTRTQLEALAIATLLHDMGMVRIPRSIIDKKGKLSALEYMEIKKHPALGVEILEKNLNLSRLSIYVAYQHHERWLGNGYPSGRAMEEIHEFARIVGLVDVYAALISPRPWREAYTPYEAMKMIIGGVGVLFDPRIVRAFVNAMGVYPVGSYIKLNNGEIAKVVRANPGAPLKPLIRIVVDAYGKPVKSKFFIDLREREDLFIEKPLKNSDVEKLLGH